MRAKRRKGQVLVIAALVIALALLSTQAYIYTLSRTEVHYGYRFLSDYVQAIKIGSEHTVTASLVNISRGGAYDNLQSNLDRWESFIAADYRMGQCSLNATSASQSPYTQGIWLDWGTDSVGVSSAYSDFTLNIGGMGAEIDLSFSLNRTTRVVVTGSYSDLGGDTKEVTVVMYLFNEGAQALTNSTTLNYLKSSSWEDPTILGDYVAVDYGNGTYHYTFTDTIPGNQVPVRVQTYDERGVFVQAEATLTEG